MDSDTDSIIKEVMEGRIGTSCCPDIEAVFEKYKKGEVTYEFLKDSIDRKRIELRGIT
jgi:hypothetical protein